METLLPHLPAIAATFVLAGIVKGVIGLGLPTVAMGLLGLVMPPAQAAVLLLVPSLVTNVWQLVTGPKFAALARRLWSMMLAICGGTWVASGVMTGEGVHLATACLGGALALYALTGLARLRLRVPARSERWAGPAIGAATGLVTGATGVFAMPAVPYLAALGLERDELIQALGLAFTVATVALGIGLAWHHALPLQGAGASVIAVIPALAGMLAGGWLRARVHPETFRKCFFAGLLVLGAELIWRGVA